MLHELRINGLPETPDSLAWSETGDLCVVANVKVHLFLPIRRDESELVPDIALRPWSTLTLEANSFSVEEWPTFTQRQYANLSIGEEMSDSHVISCSWSPPGLAKYDRCMLGVLTANGLYCLWEAIGDPTYVTSWNRTLVLSKILQPLFQSEAEEADEISPRKYRVRAAAWSREVGQYQAETWARAIAILALLNDQGEVVFLEAKHRDGDEQHERREITVIHVLDLKRRYPNCPDGLLDRLEWSDWAQIEDVPRATLTCSTAGRTWNITVEWSDTGFDCTLSDPIQRLNPSWNVSDSEVMASNDAFITHQHLKIKRAWELEKAEGYSAFTSYYGHVRYKEFLAIHLSFHPRTVIEYQIQAREISYVLFSHRRLESSHKGAENIKFDWEMTIANSTNLSDSSEPWSFVLKQITDSLEDVMSERNGILGKMIRTYLTMALFRDWMPEDTTTVLEELSKTKLSDSTRVLMEEHRETLSTQEALQYFQSIVDNHLNAINTLENCSICDRRLQWLDEAAWKCEQGHQFDLCSLTLLPIIEPGISSSCGSCSREYLDSKYIRNLCEEGALGHDLISKLCRKFTRCVYCGGVIHAFS